jgi:hypothetical protein
VDVIDQALNLRPVGRTRHMGFWRVGGNHAFDAALLLHGFINQQDSIVCKENKTEGMKIDSKDSQRSIVRKRESNNSKGKESRRITAATVCTNREGAGLWHP